jgi:nucleotide-binding universal stress UspA family protein
MRVNPRVFAVVSFVVVGILALVVAGMLDWIVGVLFLSMEFLGEFVRSVFRRRRDRRRLPARPRHPSIVPIRRRGHHRRKRAGHHAEGDLAPTSSPDQRLRILVTVGGDEPDLLEFALEECRRRQAEMILLFLRSLAVTPMGPISLPGLDEDDEARAILDRLGAETARLGVPLRTIYATTGDRPATIGEFARACEADVVLVGSPRRSRFARFLSRDLAPSILKLLPERASLTIRLS